MPFEIYHGAGRGGSIPSGKVSISVNGHARFSVDEIGKVGINQTVTIEIDKDARCIAIRACQRGETPRAVSTPSNGSRIISLGGALEVIELSAKQVRGWHDVTVLADRLLIDFSEAAP
jgi:hypothetical protein